MKPNQPNDTPRKSGQSGADTSQPEPVDWQALAISRYERMEEYRVQRDKLLEACKLALMKYTSEDVAELRRGKCRAAIAAAEGRA